MRMLNLMGLGFALFMSACVMSMCVAASETNWKPSSALIAEVEANLVLPDGSQPLDSYGRYYYGRLVQGQRVLVGEFVLDSAPGAHIIVPSDAPRVLDGGCSVINLVYDLADKKVTSLFCNGAG